MNVLETPLPGALVVEPRVFRDDRGHLLETWSRDRYAQAGLPDRFVQDNLSHSRPGVLRGLHYQHPSAQGKLISVLSGAIFDVAVDIRTGSPTFGRWHGLELSAENSRQFYIPEGFAHGLVVLGDQPAVVLYKCTGFYVPAEEGSVRWDDPEIGIAWPVTIPIVSSKDAAAPKLRDIPAERLPVFEP